MRRRPDRGAYDRKTIDAILDEARICHVGFVRDGFPVVIPTIHARAGDTLYLHASTAAGMAKDLSDCRARDADHGGVRQDPDGAVALPGHVATWATNRDTRKLGD